MYKGGANPNIELHSPDELWNIQENDEIHIDYPLRVEKINDTFSLAIAYDKMVKIWCYRNGITEEDVVPIELSFEDFLFNYVNSNNDISIPNYMLPESRRQKDIQFNAPLGIPHNNYNNNNYNNNNYNNNNNNNNNYNNNNYNNNNNNNEDLQNAYNRLALPKNTFSEQFNIEKKQFGGGKNQNEDIKFDKKFIYDMFETSKYLVRKADVLKGLNRVDATNVINQLNIKIKDADYYNFIPSMQKFLLKNDNNIRIDQICFYMYIHFITKSNTNNISPKFVQMVMNTDSLLKDIIKTYGTEHGIMSLKDQVTNLKNDMPILSFVKFRTGTDVNSTNLRFGTDIDNINNIIHMKYSDVNKPLCTTSDGKQFSCIKDKYTHSYEFGPFTEIYSVDVPNKNIIFQDMFKTHIIDELKKGTPICIIGYGPSGSGKTSTLVRLEIPGKKTEPGVILELAKEFTKTYSTCKLDIYEISSNKEKALHMEFILENNKKEWKTKPRMGYKHPNARSSFFKSPAEFTEFGSIILEFMIDRETAATLNNPDSSRSHAFFCVKFSNPINKDEGVQDATLILCDFAGVENVFDCEQDFILNAMMENPRYLPERTKYNDALKAFNDIVKKERDRKVEGKKTLGEWREEQILAQLDNIFVNTHINLIECKFEKDERQKLRSSIMLTRNQLLNQQKNEVLTIHTIDGDDTGGIAIYQDEYNTINSLIKKSGFKENTNTPENTKKNFLMKLQEFGSTNFDYQVKTIDIFEKAYKECNDTYGAYYNCFYTTTPKRRIIAWNNNAQPDKKYEDLVEFNKAGNLEIHEFRQLKQILEKIAVTENVDELDPFMDIDEAIKYATSELYTRDALDYSLKDFLFTKTDQHYKATQLSKMEPPLQDLKNLGVTKIRGSYILLLMFSTYRNFYITAATTLPDENEITTLKDLYEGIIKLVKDEAIKNYNLIKKSKQIISNLNNEIRQEHDITIPPLVELAYHVIAEEYKTIYPDNFNINTNLKRPLISEYMQAECEKRGKEGKYINSTISELRTFISDLVTRTNRTTPGFYDECLPIQCNPEVSNCFGINQYPTVFRNRGETDFTGEIAEIFETYLTANNKKIEDLKITVFCVINLDPKANNPPPVPFIDISYIIYATEVLDSFIHLNPNNSQNEQYVIYLQKVLSQLKIELSNLSNNGLLTSKQVVYAKKMNDSGNESYEAQQTQKPLIEENYYIQDNINKSIKILDEITEIVDKDQIRPLNGYLFKLIDIIEKTNATTVIGALQFTDSISKFGLYKGICNNNTVKTIENIQPDINAVGMM